MAAGAERVPPPGRIPFALRGIAPVQPESDDLADSKELKFAIESAFMLGAARVVAIDRLPERLAVARSIAAITVDYSEEDVDVLTPLRDLTSGTGLIPVSMQEGLKHIQLNCKDYTTP